jgi:DNA-binding LacI/PurR family transcriptional regulator
MATPYLTVRDRAEGYWEGLASVGIAARQVPYADTDGERDTVWAAMERLYKAAKTPTAILAMSDRAALFAIEWLKASGRSVPEDVSVIGFDGVPEGADTLPGLTTVQQPYQELAARAVAAILGGEEITARTVLPLPLVVRESTGPARKGEL